MGPDNRVNLYYVHDPKTAPSILHFDVFNDLDIAIEYVKECSDETSIYLGSLGKSYDLDVNFEKSYTKEEFLNGRVG